MPVRELPTRGAIVAALLVASQTLACKGGDASHPGEGAALADGDVPAGLADSVRVWLEMPEEVRTGEPVAIELKVQNVSDGPLDLYVTGRPIAFDLTVTDADGSVVWRRLEDEVIAAVLRIETLGPEETLVFEDRWDQRSNEGEPVAPGSYTVRGELPTESGPLVTPPISLRIVAR